MAPIDVPLLDGSGAVQQPLLLVDLDDADPAGNVAVGMGLVPGAGRR